jgi:hypothetical protein
MLLVIQTQNEENYAWQEDGTLGTGINAYWKMKGGQEYKVVNVPLEGSIDAVVEMVRGDIEISNDGFRSYIVGYGVEDDGYLSWFEKSQLEYDGEITCHEPVIDYAAYMRVMEWEYADWAAEQDAAAYGETV